MNGVRIFGEWADAGSAGVDLFFVISGFVMFITTYRNSGGWKASTIFIYARIARIYPLWWVMLSMLTIVWKLYPSIINRENLNPNWLKDYLLIYKGESPLLEVGWTLIHEMYFYILFSFTLLFFFNFKKRIYFILLWSFALITLSINNKIPSHSIFHLIFHPLTLEFVAGTLSGYALIYFKKKYGLLILIFGIFLFMISLWVSAFTSFNTLFGLKGYLDDWPRVLLFTIPSALVVYGAAAVEKEHIGLLGRMFSKIGDWSYSLYLTHVMSLAVFGSLWKNIHVDTFIGHTVALIIIYSTCLFIAYLSFRFVERPIMNTSKRYKCIIFDDREKNIASA